MDGLPFSFSLNDSCSAVLPRLRDSLEGRGLRLLETFDLQAGRLASTDCTCPHHGTADCDCQMLVLMVYGEGAAPATLMLHGSDGHTWISLPDDPIRNMDPHIAAAIERALHDI